MCLRAEEYKQIIVLWVQYTLGCAILAGGLVGGLTQQPYSPHHMLVLFPDHFWLPF